SHGLRLRHVLPPFLRGERPNAALTVSAAGLTELFARIEAVGGLHGDAVVTPLPPQGSGPVPPAGGSDAAPTPVQWRWQARRVACAPGSVTLSGVFAMNAAQTPLSATLRTWLDARACPQAEPQAVEVGAGPAADPLLAAAVIASWKALLLRLLRA